MEVRLLPEPASDMFEGTGMTKPMPGGPISPVGPRDGISISGF